MTDAELNRTDTVKMTRTTALRTALMASLFASLMLTAPALQAYENSLLPATPLSGLSISRASYPLSLLTAGGTASQTSLIFRPGAFILLPQNMSDVLSSSSLATRFHISAADLQTRRPFDPARIYSYGGSSSSFILLNDRTRLFASASFYESVYAHQHAGLDKDFYDSPVEVSDTTTGTFRYNGPVIDLLFSKQIFPRLLWGLKVNYGVERGLKDVYTKAETRQLNADMTQSLRLSLSRTLYTDLWYRRYHGQMDREMVKEYFDAFVQTWYGEDILRNEVPGSSIDVLESRDGEGFGIALGNSAAKAMDERAGSPCSPSDRKPWSFFAALESGREFNSMEQGSRDLINERGLWKRDAFRSLGLISHHGCTWTQSLSAESVQYREWAQTGIAHALFHERNSSRNSLGASLMRSGKLLNMHFAVLLSYLRYEEKNYLENSLNSRESLDYAAEMNAEWKLYPHLSLFSGLSLQQISLDHHWDQQARSRLTLSAGLDRQWNLLHIRPALLLGSDVYSTVAPSPFYAFMMEIFR